METTDTNVLTGEKLKKMAEPIIDQVLQEQNEEILNKTIRRLGIHGYEVPLEGIKTLKQLIAGKIQCRLET